MKNLIYILLFLVIPPSACAQNSGYMGKKIFIDASLRLDPYIDANANQFGTGVDVSLGRTVGEKTAVAINYAIVNRRNYESSDIGLNIHLYRSSYIAPVGKTWIVGGGVVEFNEVQEVSFGSNPMEEITVNGQSIYMKFGHEYRTIIGGGNLYFITQFAILYRINDPEIYSEIIGSGIDLNGKLGLGVVL